MSASEAGTTVSDTVHAVRPQPESLCFGIPPSYESRPWVVRMPA